MEDSRPLLVSDENRSSRPSVAVVANSNTPENLPLLTLILPWDMTPDTLSINLNDTILVVDSPDIVLPLDRIAFFVGEYADIIPSVDTDHSD